VAAARGRVRRVRSASRVISPGVWTPRRIYAGGSAPRSLAIAPDGRALYVVNYESGTVTKLRTSDMIPGI
jgi:DNA-binding beta-propeller fold protein YncE